MVITATELSPAMLRSVQRLSRSAHMAAIADRTETQLRNGVAVDIREFVKAYYPMSFVVGDSVSISVVEWLFPASHSSADEPNAVSPLGAHTQTFLISEGLLKHGSSRCLPDVLHVALSARAFTEDSETMTVSARQRALDEALQCARDADTINILIAHGADPQAVKLGIKEAPWRTSDSTCRLGVADSYVVNGVFLTGDDTILASHLSAWCRLESVRTFLQAGVDAAKAIPVAARHRRVDALRAIVEGSTGDIDRRYRHWLPKLALADKRIP